MIKYLLLFIAYVFFATSPEAILIISSLFILLIIKSIRVDLRNAILPIFQLLFLRFFIENSFALSLLEYLAEVGYDVDKYYLRAVPFEHIAYLVNPCLVAFFAGYHLVPQSRRSISIIPMKLGGIKKTSVAAVFIIVGILKFININALNFPLYVFETLLLILIVTDITRNFSWSNPLLYLFIISIIVSLNSTMIGSGSFYILLLFFFLIAFNYPKFVHQIKSNPFVTLLIASVISTCFALIIVMQTVKFEVRKSWYVGVEKRGNIVELAYNDVISGNHEASVYIINFLSRLNQAAIISTIIRRVPSLLPYEDGKTISKSFLDAFTFRFLSDKKEQSGGRQKFTKYTGRPLIGNTSMNVGIIGESYLNFSYVGSFLFMLFLGWIISQVISIRKLFNSHNRVFESVFKIGLIIILFESTSDFQMLVNAMTKSIFLISVIALYLRSEQRKLSVQRLRIYKRKVPTTQ